MYITSFFTNNGVPAVGLSPTIRIRDVVTNALLVTDAAMTEVGDGWYKYDFTTYDSNNSYAIRCDGTAVLNNIERYSAASNEAVADSDLAAAVWDEPTISHATPGTTGSAQGSIALMAGSVDAIRRVELGRWKFVNSQMIIYDDDGSTPFITFDLTDKDGNPISAEINAPAERVPV